MQPKLNISIQRLVNQLKSSEVNEVAQRTGGFGIAGEGEVDDLKGNVAHHDGIIAGIQLAEALAKARQKNMAAYGSGMQANIYYAEQEVSGGCLDRFYFIGSLNKIRRMLEAAVVLKV